MLCLWRPKGRFLSHAYSCISRCFFLAPLVIVRESSYLMKTNGVAFASSYSASPLPHVRVTWPVNPWKALIMNRMKFKSLLLTGVFCAATSLQAAVSITSGGSGAAGTGFITFDQDVTFTITQVLFTGGIVFVIDEAVVPSDGTQDLLAATGLHYDANGGTPIDVNLWRDNWATTQNSLTPSDSFFGDATSINASIGDTVTLHAGTLTLNAASATFTVFPSGSYNMFVVDLGGTQISALGVTVPEPSAYALVMAMACGVFYWGRKKLGRP